MKLVNIQELIDTRECSPVYIDMLRANHSDEEIQIYLSLITENASIDELVFLTDLSKESILTILKSFYEEFVQQKESEFSMSKIGWADSTRYIQNKRMAGCRSNY